MVCTLMGVQRIKFTSRDTGELIEGNKLHVVSDFEEKDAVMTGRRCASIFTRVPLSGIEVGSQIDLVYDQPLGTSKSRLIQVKSF